MSHLLDTLIGWHGATPAIRARLLATCCSSIRPRTLSSNSVALAILAGLIIYETRNPIHVGWLFAVILGGALPRVYAAHLCRQGRFEQAPERRALIFVVISGVYGLLWGAGPFLFLPEIGGASLGIFLMIIAFGTFMGPYAAMPGILYVRIATTGVLTLIAAALYTTPGISFACVVAGVWLTLRTDVWRGYHRTLRQQFELQEALQSRQQELEHANTSKEQANELLKRMSETDPLTGVANRRHFMQSLAGLRGPAALLMFDIDHFKAVNDSFGHHAGDAVLVNLAELVQEDLRQEDLLARIGGEEFAVALPEIGPEDAWAAAERIRERVERHVVWVGEHPVRATISIGLATIPAGETVGRVGSLLRMTDAALYEAKRQGRNRTNAVCYGSDALTADVTGNKRIKKGTD